MSKKGRRRRRHGSPSRDKAASFKDITIYDYADTSNVGIPNKIQTNVQSALEDMKLDVICPVETPLDSHDIDAIKTVVDSVVEGAGTPQETEEIVYCMYPYDVWYNIAKYIRVEDISRFACICKTTNRVVHSAAFWFNVYKRYYKHYEVLPNELKPDEVLSRKYGLRAAVIRMLHFTHAPFLMKMMAFPTVNLKYVKNWYCCTFWTSAYTHYFKFKKNLHTQKPIHNNIFDLLDDITANADENCKLLHIKTDKLIPIPNILNHRLISGQMILSHTHYRVRLTFASDSGNKTVFFDEIRLANVRLLDWWHPFYPYDNSIQFSPEQGNSD